MNSTKLLLIGLFTSICFGQRAVPTNYYFQKNFSCGACNEDWPNLCLTNSSNINSSTWGLVKLIKATGAHFSDGYDQKGYLQYPEEVFYPGKELPNGFYFEDQDPFRNNERLVVLLDQIDIRNPYCDYNSFSLIFSKSDQEALKIYGAFAYLERGFSNPITKFIFDNDVSSMITISDNIYSIPIEFDPNHKLLEMLKKSSHVNIMIEDGSDPIYLKLNLVGSGKALSRIIPPKPPSQKNIFEYRFYMGLANMNPFDYEGYIYKFIEDAKRNHDLNLDHIRNTKIYTISKNLEAGTIAESLSMNDDSSVILQIDPYQWRNASQVKRWYIIYHELGHDILNLEHGQCGRMMDAYAKDDYTWKEFEEDKKIMFEKYKEQR